RRWGYEPQAADPPHDRLFDCDRRSCRPAADAPVRLALWAGRQPPKDAAFAKLCASAEVLVLRSRLGPGQACPSATVFTQGDFDRGGSVELWRQGQAWRLRWAATERGSRPWTQGPSTDEEG
ncbi:MAG: ComEC/Rec2 family competence protein, partial [Caulobacteraceae bacterium]